MMAGRITLRTPTNTKVQGISCRPYSENMILGFSYSLLLEEKNKTRTSGGCERLGYVWCCACEFMSDVGCKEEVQVEG